MESKTFYILLVNFIFMNGYMFLIGRLITRLEARSHYYLIHTILKITVVLFSVVSILFLFFLGIDGIKLMYSLMNNLLFTRKDKLFLVLSLSWSVGFIYQFSGVLIEIRKIKNTMKRAVPCHDEKINELFYSTLKAENMEKSKIHLYWGNARAVPVACGIIHRCILVPYEIEAFFYTEKNLLGVCAHEINHHKNRDLLYRLLSQWIVSVFWFSWAGYRLVTLMIMWGEITADIHVCTNQNYKMERKEMMTVLLKIKTINPRVRLETAVVEGENLEKRVQKVMSYKKNDKKKHNSLV